MSPQRRPIEGTEFPGITVAQLNEGQLVPVQLRNVLGVGRHILVGMPGAFTPVCDSQHVPDLVRNAERLKRSGVRSLNCVVTSSPFSVAAWAEKADPEGKLNFYADGNLDLARALDLVSLEREMFLGERSCRYLLMLENGVIARARVEASMLSLQCTRSEDIFIDV